MVNVTRYHDATMKTQGKLDTLLKYLAEISPEQGIAFSLEPAEVKTAIERCGVSNNSELAFYVKSLEGRGLVISHCAGDDSIIAAQVTIDGYCHLDDTF